MNQFPVSFNYNIPKPANTTLISACMLYDSYYTSLFIFFIDKVEGGEKDTGTLKKYTGNGQTTTTIDQNIDFNCTAVNCLRDDNNILIAGGIRNKK